ncbi:sulfatase [Lentisphaera profundi]|uniref:Sulfatase n=1 Tax=Lentisphaera profundi TaxID=1658616 RepID=A0ABY7W073_9BACT|nr:sulfatase [Lentisphaera profundi]WDE98426.1 sulfatase [Lentisphaera profundi]
MAIIKYVLLVLICIRVSAEELNVKHSERVESPNIILFLVDDMGWQDSSVPFYSERTAFNDFYKTPNMEKLASQGMKFMNSYAHAICSPSRTSILTGQNPARHHVTNWTFYANRDQSSRTKNISSPIKWRMEGLQPGYTMTLPEALKTQDYKTIHVGKFHLGAAKTAGATPEGLGFDVNIAGHHAGAPRSFCGLNNYSSAYRGQGNRWQVPGLKKYHGKDIHLTDALTTEANQAIETAVKEGKKFFLHMSHYTVHVPLEKHSPYYEEYLKAGVNEAEAKYASMVQGMDASLGSILKKLEELKVAEKTIIIFASDNGGLSYGVRGKTPMGTGKNTHNWPLKAGKGSAYEGGTRTPLIVSWASLAQNKLQEKIAIKPASQCHHMVISEDYYTTICALAGVKCLDKSTLDGVDLTPLITGSKEDVHSDLVFHIPHMWGPRGPGYEPHSAIRMGDWKAIYFYEGRNWELYNLKNDISEKQDLSKSNPEKLITLSNVLKRKLKQMDAQFPIDKRESKSIEPLWPMQ